MDQKNICGSFVFKAKCKEKIEEYFFYVLYSKLKNALFWGQLIVHIIFFRISFKNNRGTKNVVMIIIFENALQKVTNRQNGQKKPPLIITVQ